MLSIWGSPQRPGCTRLSRRNVLKIGALAGTGLALPDLLRLRSQAAERSGSRAKPRAAILVFLAGGPSHIESFDPKPQAPIDIRGPFNPISTKIPGVSIAETMPELAAIADRFSLVRSCAHENSGHGGGQRFVQTGYKSASAEDELPHDYPALGSIVSKVRGPVSGGLPTYIHLPNGNDGGAKFLGNAYDAFEVYSTGRPVGLEMSPQLKLSRLDDRVHLREALDRWQRTPELQKKMESLDLLQQQALQVLSSPAAQKAFDMNLETPQTRARYGDNEFGKCCLLARRFIEAGAGIVSVRIGSWDHHGNAGGTVESGVRDNNVPLDRALAALISDLHERGLSDDVLLWCWGEFGRTPKINNLAGRDHWPQAMSVLMSGGGLKSGVVVGATNYKGEYPIERALSPTDVLATVYRQLGIDTERQFLNTAGRPISILDQGEPIAELL
ncbi:MAG TPA: DUF1501 domain-containing protein [Pirellulales bacterium]|jgi:hypothetical protein|nr:DUF1501 domain-containing protein [Pirellulales bacterium]